MIAPHPPHRSTVRDSGMPARPIEDTSLLHRWRRRCACLAAGGHWWHPADAMIEWFCCSCGADRDGMPVDGPGPLGRLYRRLRRDQGGCAVPSPAGKNDQATTRAPLPPRPDDAAEAAARAHPLHGVISEALRWGNPAGERGGAPTDHLWGTAYGGSRTWHADPDEVAALVLRAIAAAPSGPATRAAWLDLRAAVVPPPPAPYSLPITTRTEVDLPDVDAPHVCDGGCRR